MACWGNAVHAGHHGAQRYIDVAGHALGAPQPPAAGRARLQTGMAPLVIGLLMATTWVLASAHDSPATDWRLWLLTAATAMLVVAHPAAPAVDAGRRRLAGALGWV